jgi:thiamine biosynthesis lipoprotein
LLEWINNTFYRLQSNLEGLDTFHKIKIPSMKESAANRQTNLNRRAFLKITAVIGGLALGGSLLTHLKQVSPFKLQQTRHLMGTLITLTILTPNKIAGENAIAATFAEIERLIAIFDHRHQAGPVAQLNREGVLWNPPPELHSLIDLALNTSQLSKGAFDISIKPLLDISVNSQSIHSSICDLINYRYIHSRPQSINFKQQGMGITLDGIAKGRVIDGGVSILRSLGFENVMVEAGGDLYASQVPSGDSPWRIGVENPRNEKTYDLIGAFDVEEKGVATSGDYRYYFSKDHADHHIKDPRTGISPQELCSVTVLAPDATLADALSTTLMVMGTEEGLALIDSTPGVEALLITKSLEHFPSRDFPELS